MRVNVCVNGTFRYPDYVRFYEETGALNRFYFAHRRSRTAGSLGLPPRRVCNLWPKHYASAAAFRLAPTRLSAAVTTALCDRWQDAVLRRWEPCDTLETVIGGVADRVIAFARREGTKVLGHPVTTHPITARAFIDRSRETLGLRPLPERRADLARRVDEIAACDALVTDSGFVARSFMDHGIASDRIAVVQPRIDRSRFFPRTADDIDRDRFLVVCVGIVTPRKAQHVLLQAWRRLALPNSKLLLVGAMGADARAVLRGHENHFTHISHVDQVALRALLIRASCFVLPSAEDGFGQAPLEAMACAVPTILTQNVGASDLIHDGINGFVVPPFDVEALMAILDRLYRDRDFGEHVGQVGAANVATAGSWSDYVGQVLELHRRMLHGSTPSDRAAA